MRQLNIRSCFFLTLLGVVASTSVASAQSVGRGRAGADSEELTSQDREVLEWANSFASEVTQVLDRWITSRELSEEKLYSYLYYPIPKTDPPKYTSDFDSLSDRDFPAIQEKYLNKSAALQYAVVADVNGYVPTHNQKYSMRPTGNRAVDLLNNRTKRLFGDRGGLAAARSEAPYLLQQYKRDTGEVMADISVPVNVRGKHWGCVRISYRRIEK
jgi:methyl-accepting chemotaxis protein